jgi:hypothetical protein
MSNLSNNRLSIVTVYNLQGAKMHNFTTTNKTEYTINTSTYSAGTYIVVVENANGQTQQYKLIKQ